MSTQSPATDALKAKIIPRIQLANADGREAFANLGKAAGAKIDVANEVQGIVTLELVNVTFDVAMQTMARQLDAIHFYQGDTVYVVRKPTGGGQSMMTPTSAEIAEMVEWLRPVVDAISVRDGWPARRTAVMTMARLRRRRSS